MNSYLTEIEFLSPLNSKPNASLTTNNQCLSHKRMNSERCSRHFTYNASCSSDFIQEMLREVRRISPSFTFNLGKGPLTQQILCAFKESVDNFLMNYSNRMTMHHKTKSQTVKTTFNEVSQANHKETAKNLLKFEKILKLKEEKITEKLREVEFELVNLKKLTSNLEKREEKWLKIKKEEMLQLENDKNSISAERQRLEELYSLLKSKKTDLDERESSLNTLATSLSQEKSTIVLKTVVHNKAIWELNKKQSELESQQSILSLKLEQFEHEKSEFEREKNLFLLEKKLKSDKNPSKKHSKCLLPKLQKKNSGDLDKAFDIHDISPLNESRDHTQSINLFESGSGDNGKDLELVYIELNERIEKINHDLELREHAIMAKEAELNEKFDQFIIIEQCLRESKLYLDEFNEQTAVEFENNSNELLGLMHSLKSRKLELEGLVVRLQQELEIVKEQKFQLEVVSEDPEFNFSSKSNSDVETISNTINSESD